MKRKSERRGVDNRRRFVDPMTLAELDKHPDLSWTVEVGSKRHKLVIEGEFVTVLPMGSIKETSKRPMMNCRAYVRQHLRRLGLT